MILVVETKARGNNRVLKAIEGLNHSQSLDVYSVSYLYADSEIDVAVLVLVLAVPVVESLNVNSPAVGVGLLRNRM